MKKRKAILSLIFAVVLVTLSGCQTKQVPEQISLGEESEEQVEEDDDLAKAVEDARNLLDEKAMEAYEFSARDFEENVETYTMEDIAEINGKDNPDDVNALFDVNGYLVFLGEGYAEEQILNEEDAFKSLGHVADLIGLGDANLTHFRTDVSAVTGNVYYTFNQTATGMLGDEEVHAKFFNSLVKVITDKDGYLVGLSADINHDSSLNYDYTQMVTKEDAQAAISEMIGSGLYIYDELTEFVYWTDPGTVAAVSEGKVCPAWVITADADFYESGNKDMKGFKTYVVSAEPRIDADGEESVHILESYYTDSPDTSLLDGDYVSELYFDGMKDAGTYTYKLDMDWVKAAYPEYKGDKTMEVSVPVMYNEGDGLYYLGCYERRITVGNTYDFSTLNTLNSYVTDTPEDKESWHFYDDGDADNGITYFNDPDYVISSYKTMCDVYDEFADRYGFKAVDTSGMPILLTVYGYDGEYPEDITGFMENAYNAGQIRDWQVMATSPMLAACLDHVVMGHEFTHGINSQFTNSQYLNAPGAIMESFADIIGSQMAMVYGHVDEDDEWKLGGKYSEVLRDMSDPTKHNNPMYIGGKYYVSDVDAANGNYLDYGGVHINSGICNYLAYAMVNGVEGYENNNVFTVEESLDMWFETLYCANYMTDYYDVAHYLLYAADHTGMSDEKYFFLFDLLADLGMINDADGEYGIGFAEDAKEYCINVNFENEEMADMVSIGVGFADEKDNYYVGGSIGEDNVLYYETDPSKNLTPIIYIGDVYNDCTIGNLALDNDVNQNTQVLYVERDLSVGENLEISNEKSLSYFSFDGDCMQLNADDSYTFNAAEPGNYFMTFVDNKEKGEYTLLHLYVD